MKSIEVVRYTDDLRSDWDDFVRASKNGTFLHERAFMEYHRDRFHDWSLLAYDDKGNILALLPANRTDDTLYSHRGLTYGGFLTGEDMKIEKMLALMEELQAFLSVNGITTLFYKAIPRIYHRFPADEDLYALHNAGAQVIDQTLLTVLPPDERPAYQSRRKRMVKKGRKANLTVRESHDLETYWALLSAVLRAVHDADPVHTLTEIQSLQANFQQQIRLFASYDDDEMLAGVLVFETDLVARAQYIANNLKGRDLGALDLLFDHLINTVYPSHYLSFGSSLDPTTDTLNTGLVAQKEGFGGRTLVQLHYRLSL
jgi:hypothetical protein